MKTTLTVLSIFFLALFAGSALAQTPDGEPPSVETVCDGETGAAFGLCNAYCEAMDCDCPTAANPDCTPNANATACNRVANRFEQKTGRAIVCEPEPPPPATCPCLDINDARWAEGDTTWVDFADGMRIVTSCTNAGGIITLDSLDMATFFSDSATVTTAGDNSSCSMINMKIDGTVMDTFAPITAEEAEVCAGLLVVAGDAVCP